MTSSFNARATRRTGSEIEPNRPIYRLERSTSSGPSVSGPYKIVGKTNKTTIIRQVVLFSTMYIYE